MKDSIKTGVIVDVGQVRMNKLLTPQEMAGYLGVKVSTIYQWTHIGFIPHVKLGRFVRFKEQDVHRWLESKSNNGRKTRSIDFQLK